MMSIFEIGKSLSQQARIEYLLKMAGRYRNLNLMTNVIHGIIHDIREQKHDAPVNNPDVNQQADNSEHPDAGCIELRKAVMMCMIEKHKAHIRPEDWLYLKALVLDENEKSWCLIRQAQALAPENGHIYASIIDHEKDKPEIYYDLVPDFHIHREDKALQNYFNVLKLLLQLEFPFSEQSAAVIFRLLKDIRLNPAQLCGMLSHMAQYAKPGLLMEVIVRLETNDNLVNRIYALVKGMLYYEEKQYEHAIESFLTANIESLPFEEWEKIKQLNKLALAYHHSGKQAEAASIWKYITGDRGRSESGLMACSDAFLQLATYYKSTGRLREARDVLCNISERALDTLLFYGMGFEYYSLLGEICRADKNYTDALGYYCKAYKFGHREEMQVIILELEKLCE